jgi:hypothetical protein
VLDAFETKLADMLADRLAGDTLIGDVRRPRADSTPPGATAARLTVEVVAAVPTVELGDDRPEVLGQPGAYELRPVLSLSGGVVIALALGTADAAQAGAQRGLLLQALDHVLLALHGPDVRNGNVFGAAPEQGFSLHAFRLERITAVRAEVVPGAADESGPHMYCRYAFAGRFWPVEAPVAGDIITDLPMRIALLPAEVPAGDGAARARAGGPDVAIPVRLDVRALGGATRRLIARLMGASPPGQLVGSAVDAPAGSVSYAADPDGAYRVIYRPPASLDGTARVRIRLALARAEGAAIPVETVDVEVQGA